MSVLSCWNHVKERKAWNCVMSSKDSDRRTVEDERHFIFANFAHVIGLIDFGGIIFLVRSRIRSMLLNSDHIGVEIFKSHIFPAVNFGETLLLSGDYQ